MMMRSIQRGANNDQNITAKQIVETLKKTCSTVALKSRSVRSVGTQLREPKKQMLLNAPNRTARSPATVRCPQPRGTETSVDFGVRFIAWLGLSGSQREFIARDEVRTNLSIAVVAETKPLVDGAQSRARRLTI